MATSRPFHLAPLSSRWRAARMSRGDRHVRRAKAAQPYGEFCLTLRRSRRVHRVEETTAAAWGSGGLEETLTPRVDVEGIAGAGEGARVEDARRSRRHEVRRANGPIPHFFRAVD